MQIGDTASAPLKCIGDSGGPTYLTFDDGLEPARRIIGVTSHAYDDQGCESGTVDTRVDAYWDWLDQAMRAGCANDTRTYCAGGGALPGPELPEQPPKPTPNGCGATVPATFGLALMVLIALSRTRRARPPRG